MKFTPLEIRKGGGESQTFEVCTFIFNFDEEFVDGGGDDSDRVMVLEGTIVFRFSIVFKNDRFVFGKNDLFKNDPLVLNFENE